MAVQTSPRNGHSPAGSCFSTHAQIGSPFARHHSSTSDRPPNGYSTESVGPTGPSSSGQCAAADAVNAPRGCLVRVVVEGMEDHAVGVFGQLLGMPHDVHLRQVQPPQDGLVGVVPSPRRGKAPVEFDGHTRYVPPLDALPEELRCPPRPHRVGTRRPHANLEDIAYGSHRGIIPPHQAPRPSPSPAKPVEPAPRDRQGSLELPRATPRRRATPPLHPKPVACPCSPPHPASTRTVDRTPAPRRCPRGPAG